MPQGVGYSKTRQKGGETMDQAADRLHPPPNLAQRIVGAIAGKHPFGRAMGDVQKGLTKPAPEPKRK
jgi:hypothetical protein